MKKVIEGKVYNTENAELLGEFWNNLPHGDFHSIDEALYRTKKGAFFLAGHGGAFTKYSQPCGCDGTCGGEGIFPLSEAEAREWAERYCDTDTVIRYFATEEA